MTVENTQNKMPPLQMGTATEYPFTFAVLLQDPTEEEALEAIKASVLQADGTEIELEYGTDYTVTLNTDRIGGTLTVNNIRTASDYLTIYRQYEQTQEVDYKDFNSAPAETFEQCFDKLTMLSQQQQEEINRSLKLNVSSTITNPSLPEPIANNTLIWDSEGTGLDNYDIIGENNQFKAEVNSAIATGQAEIQAQFDTFEAQVNTDLTDGLQNIQTQLDTFESQVNTNLTDGLQNIQTQLDTFESETNANIQEFEDGIDAKIATVAEAADKINQLEESVENATTAATNAQNSATNALNSANAASQLVEDAQETLSTRADIDLSNLSSIGQAKFDEKANLDLSNLSETGEKHFLNKSQITNCLLEVPQNIKLELTDGVLTLKAGSKVIVPNGVGVFDEVVINSDINFTYTYVPPTDTPCMLFINKQGTQFVHSRTVRTCFSGSLQPTGNYRNWYNTSENLMYSIAGSVTIDGSGFSFPIAIITQGSDGVTKSIDQVFNGMGYIGSTIWVDKGVKGLIPNGRNADGTLKNIEVVTNKVSTRTENWHTDYVLFIDQYSYCSFVRKNGHYFEQDDMPHEPSSSWDVWYSPKENVYRIDRNSTYWEQFYVACAGEFGGANYSITSFQPKLPVHLLTYDDIKINNPYFFGQYIWSEFAPSNLSWLKSSGQWNSGSGYQSFYDWALAKANAGTSGFKLSTASYTDYDFVVNTSAKTFRLPIKVQNTPLNDTAPVAGTGIALGLNSGTVYYGMVLDNGSSHNYEIFKTGAYGASTQGTAYGNVVATPADYPIGVTTDASKSGLIANLSANTNVSLYFYVGETVKDPTLINMAQIASNFADKIGRAECKAYITQTYKNGTSWYRVYSDGWCEQGGLTVVSSGGDGIYTTSFLKPFIDTNYTITATIRAIGYTTSYQSDACISAISTSSFSGFMTGGNTFGRFWQACGYIS